MAKKNFKYNIQLNMTEDNQNQECSRTINFDFENHDDIFHIIEMMQDKNFFENRGDAIEFALGLKLFGEVILRNRNLELFKELEPAFIDFMRKLKRD